MLTTTFIILHCPSITQNEAQFWIRCASLLYGHDILRAVLLSLHHFTSILTWSQVQHETWYNPTLYKLYVGQSKIALPKISIIP